MTSMHDVPPVPVPNAPLPGPPARPLSGDSSGDRADDRADDRAAHPGGTTAQVEPGDLADRPLAEHADVFERLHAQLQAALAEIDHA